SFYKFLVREGNIVSSPMQLVQALKTPKRLPVVVESEKMVNLLEKGRINQDSFEEVRDFLILEMLFGTGVRVSELLAIQEGDIDTYNSRIRIIGRSEERREVEQYRTLVEE